MYRQIKTVTRPDQSAPFWLQSNTLPPGFFSFVDPYVISGDLIDFNNTVSPDGLTFVRHMDFVSQAAYDAMIVEFLKAFPTIVEDQQAYNTLHGHVSTITFETI